MMAVTLLPPTASALERAIAQVDAERLEAIEVKISTLWNPWACPAPFLPWLAWSFSVDVWNADWPEAKKRAVIAASFEVHRRKGTRLAVQTALDALGLRATITEWWQTDPRGQPYTFGVDLAASEIMTADLQRDARRAIEAAKNVRSHMSLDSGLRIATAQSAAMSLAAVAAPRQTLDAHTASALRDAASAGLGLAGGSHAAPRFRALTKAA